MLIPSEAIIEERFREQDAELHSFKVSSDRSVIVYDASYPLREGAIPDLPILFVVMCLSGGGEMRQRMAKHEFEGVIEPGGLGIAAPSSPGYGFWPEMRVIAFGVAVRALTESFGAAWPTRLKSEALLRPQRDPLVEATMMQVGYTHAGRISDSVLLHAAHMVVHQLIDADEDPANEEERTPIHALSKSAVDEVRLYVRDRIEKTINVDDLARHVGISRHHFSRRFRAATDKSPYQFILDMKLEEAADAIRADRKARIIDVAAMVGYRNPSQFSEAFKRRYGVTPRFWRSRAN